jgi:hypothetical protein
MQNYHFYEEIGKAKHSVVYRCRRKKCIEFCAIKSVDKSDRQKVLNEVFCPSRGLLERDAAGRGGGSGEKEKRGAHMRTHDAQCIA